MSVGVKHIIPGGQRVFVYPPLKGILLGARIAIWL